MKKILFVSSMILLTTFSAHAQRGNQKWYNTAIGLRIEGGAGSSGTLGPTYERALSSKTSVETMILTNLSTGIEGVFMHKWINTIPDVPTTVRWYCGVGLHLGTWGSKSTSFVAGPNGFLGIGYSIPDIPINITLDWHPSVDVRMYDENEKMRFNAAKFGFSVRYIVE